MTDSYRPAGTSIQPNSTITVPALPEPVEVRAVTRTGAAARIMGVGRRTRAIYNAILRADQLSALEVLTDRMPFDGDARKFELGIAFTASCVREWLGRMGVKTLYIEWGSPRKNGYVENCDGKLRDALLKRESFDTLLQAQVLIERCRRGYDTVRPHIVLGYRRAAALCGRFGCASATAQGWSV